MEKKLLASTIRQFTALDDSELDDVLSYFQPHIFEKGDFLVKAGQVCDRVAFVHSGLLRTWYEVEGEEVTHWISDAGYFDTSLSSFSFQTPSRWNIQAITTCELYTLDCKSHRILLEKYLPWMKFESQLLIYSYLGLEDRMFSQLHQTAEERYEKLLVTRRHLVQQAPLQYLASMLGMKPETLSRLRKKLTENIS